jgi:autoinducer 2-degrading protein
MKEALAVIVAFEVRVEDKAALVALARENALDSMTSEAGCQRFDVIVPDGDAVHLYEIYESRTAFDAHLASAHFVAFDEATRALVKAKQVVTGPVVEACKESR